MDESHPGGVCTILPDMRRARVDIRVREDEKVTWEKWAEDLGMSSSELIREAVPYFVRDKRKSRRQRVASVNPRSTEAGCRVEDGRESDSVLGTPVATP